MRKIGLALWVGVFALAACVPLVARGGDCLRPAPQSIRVIERVVVQRDYAPPAAKVVERVVVQKEVPAEAPPAKVVERVIEREVVTDPGYDCVQGSRFVFRDTAGYGSVQYLSRDQFRFRDTVYGGQRFRDVAVVQGDGGGSGVVGIGKAIVKTGKRLVGAFVGR